MGLKRFIKKLIFPNTYSEEAYISFLRSKNIKVGENVRIWSPNHTYIDTTKPYLISIGDYVKITQGVSILAHDYSHSVMRRTFGQFRGGTLPVSIGNNVFIGINSTILMGTNIGNNCIVGANSLVSGKFPDGSVIAGSPAKVICSINDLWEKTTKKWIDDAVHVARTIYKNKGSYPTIEEMSDAYVCLYLPRTDENVIKYKKFFDLSADDFSEYRAQFMSSEPYFKNFEEFLSFCNFEDIQ